MEILKRVGKFILREIDSILAISVAAVGSAYVFLKDSTEPWVSALILSMISATALSLLRNRENVGKLSTSVKVLLKKHQPVATADTFFTSRTNDAIVLSESTDSLMFVQETGNKILEDCREEIAAFLMRKGEVAFVVTAPSKNTSRLMAFRNAMLATPRELNDRTRNFDNQIASLIKRVGEAAHSIEVRYCPYPIGDTMVCATSSDPGEDSRVLVRIAGFKVPFEKKLDFALSKNNAGRTFQLFSDQCTDYYGYSSKVILISGQPGVGKTSLIEEMVKEYVGKEAYWMLTKSEVVDGNRVGFKVMTSENHDCREIARKQASGDYKVDDKLLEDLSEEVDAAVKSGKILVIDELGPIQVRSARFRESITEAIGDPRTTIFGTIAAKSDEFLKGIRLSPRSRIIELSSQQDSVRVKELLKAEYEKSKSLYETVPMEMW